MDDVVWTDELHAITVQHFSEQVGPKIPIPSDPLQVFMLFFTTSVLQIIVDQTNLYALQCMGQEDYGRWTQVTLEEIQAYFGLMILMGIVKLPALADYWKSSEIFHYSPIARRITRDRFLSISRYLHFSDKSTLPGPGEDGYDKLAGQL